MQAPNVAAVITATVLSFVIGGLWYSPLLFGKAWMAENGFTEESLQGGAQARIFGGSFILSLVIATNLGFFLGPESDVIWGVTAGILAGLGWVSLSMGITYLFERRSLKLFMINAGYHVVTYAMMGAILGAWH